MTRRFFKTLVSPGPRYSLSFALSCILCSVLICIPTLHWLLFPETFSLFSKKPLPLKNMFLVTTTPYTLPEIFFSEALHLSADHPISLSQFSVKQAEAALEKLNIFSSISIEKAPDNKGIIIYYALHTPIGYLGNRSNTLLNKTGHCFPCQPFFHTLNLPKIFFPLSDLKQNNLPSWKLDIINELTQELHTDPPHIIDLSHTDAYPIEITVTLHSKNILRLRYDQLKSAIMHYHQLQTSTIIEKNHPYIYDLRFPNYALLNKQQTL